MVITDRDCYPWTETTAKIELNPLSTEVHHEIVRMWPGPNSTLDMDILEPRVAGINSQSSFKVK